MRKEATFFAHLLVFRQTLFGLAANLDQQVVLHRITCVLAECSNLAYLGNINFIVCLLDQSERIFLSLEHSHYRIIFALDQTRSSILFGPEQFRFLA